MYCKYCGAKIPEGAVVCPNCGPGRKTIPVPEEVLAPAEYFKTRGTPEAKARLKLLWRIVVLAAALPALLIVLFLAGVRITHPGATVTGGAVLAPVGMCLPSLILGAMTCTKLTTVWAIIYLVGSMFTNPLCVPGPVLVLLLMRPLSVEYGEYLRRTERGE